MLDDLDTYFNVNGKKLSGRHFAPKSAKVLLFAPMPLNFARFASGHPEEKSYRPRS